jgi:hypothetical protein
VARAALVVQARRAVVLEPAFAHLAPVHGVGAPRFRHGCCCRRAGCVRRSTNGGASAKRRRRRPDGNHRKEEGACRSASQWSRGSLQAEIGRAWQWGQRARARERERGARRPPKERKLNAARARCRLCRMHTANWMRWVRRAGCCDCAQRAARLASSSVLRERGAQEGGAALLDGPVVRHTPPLLLLLFLPPARRPSPLIPPLQTQTRPQKTLGPFVLAHSKQQQWPSRTSASSSCRSPTDAAPAPFGTAPRRSCATPAPRDRPGRRRVA